MKLALKKKCEAVQIYISAHENTTNTVVSHLILVPVGGQMELSDDGQRCWMPRIACVILNVAEHKWFGVDNTDLSNAVDVNFEVVSITVISVTVHSSSLNLLHNDRAKFMERKRVAIVAIICIAADCRTDVQS